MTIRLRPARNDDLTALSTVWHDGWHDAHDGIVPAAWSAYRGRESFRQRTPGLIPAATVAVDGGGPPSEPEALCGFFSTDGNVVGNLFVAATHRRKGVGALLLAAAEDRLAAAGHATARLECRQGNHRARRFYEKAGWRVVEDREQHETVGGAPLILRSWMMEKLLSR